MTGPAASAAPLDGRTVVITGASDGIGAAAARQVARLGARVIVVGRSAQKTAAVAESIGATALTGDFARLEDVRRVAGQILALCPRIDVLANNAGAMFPHRVVTADGNEMTFQVNYLAGFLLTGLLRPRLAATPGWNRYVARTPEHGAEPLTALAVRSDPHTVNGAYLHRFSRRERLVAAQGRDAQLGRQLWERSAELTGLPG